MTTTPQEPGSDDPGTDLPSDPDVDPTANPTDDDPVPGSGAEDPGDPA
jgi:hypothetical protein